MPFTITASTLPLLPEEISYGFPGGPEFITDVSIPENRNEQRMSYSDEPYFAWDLGYLIKSEEEAYALRKFFHACRGRWRAFRMKDWEDYKSGAVYNTPAFNDISLGAAAAGQTQFQLKKLYSEGAYQTTVTIIKPNGATIKIGEAGVEVTSGWTINEDTGIITRGTPLAGGEVITWGGEWFHKCRFDMDKFPTTPEGSGVGSIRAPVVAIPLQDGK